MRISIKRPVNEKVETLWFPWKAEDFEKVCLGLEIAPSTEPNCIIVDVSDKRLSTFLKDKACNIDELDYLMKRLESFDNDQLQRFYAMAYAEKAETTADLINITFNTHCYSLVADFSDLDAVGRKMYLTEQGAVSEKELQSFDGRAYFEKLLAENPKPRATPYGLLYQNNNPQNDPVRLANAQLEELDYTELYRAYSSQGRKSAAEPRIIFEVLVYGYMCGIYSTSKLEEACRKRVDFMWLLQGEPIPDYSTFARFRSGSTKEAVEDLFYQFMKLEEIGETENNEVFIDGTKIESMANRYTFV